MIATEMTAMTGGTAAATTPADARLKPAAHEFEACMMKELLEPLQKDTLTGDTGDDSGEGSETALTSFGSEALARAISDHGGFGIATKILEHFSHGKGAPDGTVGTWNFGRK